MELGTVNSTKTISRFSDEHAYLSNFYPIEIEYCGDKYPSLEHAYQAAKTDNVTERATIRSAKTPVTAKRLGKTVTLTNEWERKKLIVSIRNNLQNYEDLNGISA